MKHILTIGLTLFSLSLSALAPYYSEQKEGYKLFIFHGSVENDALPEVRTLEAKFMQYRNNRWFYQRKLEELGVQVEKIEGHEHEPSGLPLDVRQPDLPEGVEG